MKSDTDLVFNSDDFQDMKKEFQEVISKLKTENERYEKALKRIAEEIIPVITDSHQAKWVYLEIATNFRDMARKATCDFVPEHQPHCRARSGFVCSCVKTGTITEGV